MSETLDYAQSRDSFVLRNAGINYEETTGTHGMSTDYMARDPLAEAARDVPTLNSKMLAEETMFNWRVGMVPIKDTYGGGGGRLIHGHSQLIREDTGGQMGLVKTGYIPLQNLEALEFSRILEEEKIAEIAYVGLLNGGRDPFILMKKINGLVEILPNDPIQRYYFLKWCHGSKTEKIEFQEISMRLVCANGMLGSEHQSITLDYKAGAAEALKDLSSLISESDQRMVESEQYLRRMAYQPFADYDELETYFRRCLGVPYRDPNKIIEDDEAFEKELKKGSKTIEKMMRIYDWENGTMPAANKDTLLVGFNTVTNLETHHRGNRGGRTRFKRNNYGAGKTTRKRAFSIAKSMLGEEVTA